jgi:hypothetical protein
MTSTSERQLAPRLTIVARHRVSLIGWPAGLECLARLLMRSFSSQRDLSSTGITVDLAGSVARPIGRAAARIRRTVTFMGFS